MDDMEFLLALSEEKSRKRQLKYLKRRNKRLNMQGGHKDNARSRAQQLRWKRQRAMEIALSTRRLTKVERQIALARMVELDEKSAIDRMRAAAERARQAASEPFHLAELPALPALPSDE